MTDPKHDMLDDIFAQARDVAPMPSEDLMARVLADAALPMPRSGLANRKGLWARLSDALGGWPALGGLAAATLAGLWVGISPPASVADFTASLIGETVSVNLFADTDFLDAGDLADG